MENVILYLNKAAEGFWSFSGSMLIQSGILIVLLLVIDRLIRKRVRAVFRYCIWMLVFVKLLLPPSLCLPTGVGYWCGLERTEVKSAMLPPEQTDVFVAEQGLQERPEASNLEQPTQSQRPAITNDNTHIPPQQSEALAVAAPTVSLTWQAFIFLGWGVGVLVLSVLLIQRFLFVKSLIAQSEPAQGRVLETLNQCRKQVGLNRSIQLRLTANMLSPAACGLLNPVILIPASLLGKLTKDKLKTVLIHELAHIKRGDLWVNFLQTVLQIAYFYNPLLWIANAVVRGIREKAVDEMVLTKLGDQADTYSNTLIDIAEIAFSRPHFSLRLVGVVESKKALTDRIKHILSRPFPKSAKIGLMGLVALFLAATVLLPMAKGSGEKISVKKPELMYLSWDDGGYINSTIDYWQDKVIWRPDGETLNKDDLPGVLLKNPPFGGASGSLMLQMWFQYGGRIKDCHIVVDLLDKSGNSIGSIGVSGNNGRNWKGIVQWCQSGRMIKPEVDVNELDKIDIIARYPVDKWKKIHVIKKFNVEKVDIDENIEVLFETNDKAEKTIICKFKKDQIPITMNGSRGNPSIEYRQKQGLLTEFSYEVILFDKNGDPLDGEGELYDYGLVIRKDRPPFSKAVDSKKPWDGEFNSIRKMVIKRRTLNRFKFEDVQLLPVPANSQENIGIDINPDREMILTLGWNGEKAVIPGPVTFPEKIRKTWKFKRWKKRKQKDDVQFFTTHDNEGYKYEASAIGFREDDNGVLYEYIPNIKRFRPDGSLEVETFWIHPFDENIPVSYWVYDEHGNKSMEVKYEIWDHQSRSKIHFVRNVKFYDTNGKTVVKEWRVNRNGEVYSEVITNPDGNKYFSHFVGEIRDTLDPCTYKATLPNGLTIDLSEAVEDAVFSKMTSDETVFIKSVLFSADTSVKGSLAWLEKSFRQKIKTIENAKLTSNGLLVTFSYPAGHLPKNYESGSVFTSVEQVQNTNDTDEFAEEVNISRLSNEKIDLPQVSVWLILWSQDESDSAEEKKMFEITENFELREGKWTFFKDQ